MHFKSTRGNKDKLNASQAIINGLCNDGGLYVPSEFPNLSNKIEDLSNLSYKELALEILNLFLVDFTKEELNDCIDKAYDSKFDTSLIAPISKVGDNYFLELYHGPTSAFKDMALTIMPHLLQKSLVKNNIEKEVVILTATSGDTGKAALEGFKDIDQIKIIVFFPEEGVSPVQKLQMRSQEGKNTFVVGIDGNFDDAQSSVKEIFNNNKLIKELSEKGYILSSANSINIGRLLPQIVYYFYAYFELVRKKEIHLYEKINFVVPTGNFGNILAAYYAKNMGLPINKLICASNDNNVLYDFFETGIYDKNRKLKLTTSPSMDILISSNLERLLYEICNRDTNIVNSLVADLNNKNKYEITDKMKSNLNIFAGEYANEKEVKKTIKYIFDEYDYLIDTHTAVAFTALEKYLYKNNDDTKNIIVSTASPYKFSEDVLKSLDFDTENLSEFEIIDKLSKESNTIIPYPIEKLKDAKVIHKNYCEKSEILKEIKNILKV